MAQYFKKVLIVPNETICRKDIEYIVINHAGEVFKQDTQEDGTMPLFRGPIDYQIQFVFAPVDFDPVLQALKDIVEIGKRDLSNPKYDGYFEDAKQAIKNAEK